MSQPFDCPRCRFPHTHWAPAGSGARPAPPAVGDLALCLACGALLEIGHAGIPRWLTYHEARRVLEADGALAVDVFHGMLGILSLRPSLVEATSNLQALKKPFGCLECGRTFADVDGLFRHATEAHPA